MVSASTAIWASSGTIPVLPTATATSSPTETPVEWDYVALGDSRTGSSLWALAYHNAIETDLGVQVRLPNRAVGGQTTEELIEFLRTDRRLREQVANAQVMTVLASDNAQYGALGARGPFPADCAPDAYEALLDDVIWRSLHPGITGRPSSASWSIITFGWRGT